MPQMNKDTNEKLSMTLSTNDVAVEITEETCRVALANAPPCFRNSLKRELIVCFF